MKLDRPAMTGLLVKPDRQAQRAPEASPGRLEKLDLQALPVSRGPGGNLAPQGQWGLRAQRGPRGTKETPVKPALPDRKVQQGLRVQPVLQEQKGPQDHPD